MWLIVTSLDGLLFSGYDMRIFTSLEEASEMLQCVQAVDKNSKIAEVKFIG